jgi:hypothetical protein
VGIDLNPIDVCDNDAVRWLEALIWPDQATRLARLRGAVAIAREDPPRVLAGDASVLVAEAMAEAPEGTALCVYHTFAIYQFPAEARARLTAALIQASHSRGEVFDLDMSGVAGGHAELRLTRYRNGQPEEALLARCGPHGQWIEWLTWNARTDVSSHGGCR